MYKYSWEDIAVPWALNQISEEAPLCETQGCNKKCGKKHPQWCKRSLIGSLSYKYKNKFCWGRNKRCPAKGLDPMSSPLCILWDTVSYLFLVFTLFIKNDMLYKSYETNSFASNLYLTAGKKKRRKLCLAAAITSRVHTGPLSQQSARHPIPEKRV